MSEYKYQESAYKKRLREEARQQAAITEEVEKKAVTARRIFLDESRSAADRLEVAANMGTFKEPEDIEQAIRIFQDRDQPEAIRSSAFSGISSYVLSNEALMEAAIAAVKAGEGEGHIALAAINVLQLAEISAPAALEAQAAAYKDALRSVIDHKNKNLRTTALEILSVDKDEYAQRRLIESLEKPGDNLIEPEVAIQLLSGDLHANYYSVLRNIVQNPPNTIAKREAIRNLGSDATSQDLLLETIENSDEEPETRHAAAMALNNLSPELAAEESKKIIINEDGEHLDELKTALLNTLIYTGKKPDKNQEIKSDDIGFGLESFSETDAFPRQLAELKKTSKSQALQEMIDLYLNGYK